MHVGCGLRVWKGRAYPRHRGQTGPARMHRTSGVKQMGLGSRGMLRLIACACLAFLVGATGHCQSSSGATTTKQGQTPTEKQSTRKDTKAGVPALPRGKKLVLKDGTFQMVRDYRRNAERVRYLSSERGDWEEIPAAMVDWDATAKAATAEQAEEDALAKKIHAQEQAQKIETMMDVDASLQVALVRATVKGNKRQLESIRSLFGEQLEEKRNSISIQRWEIAPTVFRFTISEPLPPGEYALAEILPDGMNLYVWDFGVDGTTGAKATAPAKKN